MKIAILSDIHGNLEALQEVQQDLERFKTDRVVCLGDLVGYGPDPEAVVNLVRKSGYSALVGNHEAALSSASAREWMNFLARDNSIETEFLLSEENLQYCRDLPLVIVIEKNLFVHGSPPDSVRKYIYTVTDDEVERLFSRSEYETFFVGHTHELMLVFQEQGETVRQRLHQGTFTLEQGKKYIINCGSVGQPRDMDNRAKYCLWDSESRILEVRAVKYDVECTARKIIERGFPKSYASRLR